MLKLISLFLQTERLLMHLVTKQARTMLEEMKRKYHAEFSVIAMHEHNFNKQQFWFANKAFFADDAIQ